MTTPELNPYQEPAELPAQPDREESRARATRRRNLNHECGIRAFGVILLVGVAIGALRTLLGNGDVDILMATLLIPAGAVGFGLVQLKPWSRPTAIVLVLAASVLIRINGISVIGLCLLCTNKGGVVLSSRYQEVLEHAPTNITWRVIGFTLLLVVAGAAISTGFALLFGS